MDWDSKDLPSAFKAFKTHAQFMFGGPLKAKEEPEKCNYLMLLTGDHGRQIYFTWKLSEDVKISLDVHFQKFEEYCEPKSNIIYARKVFTIKNTARGRDI